jgi:hypothetical protein
MNYNHNMIVTPDRLLNPFAKFIHSRYYKPTQEYLQEKRIKRIAHKPYVPDLATITSHESSAVKNIPQLASTKNSKLSLKNSSSKLNKSCRIRKNVDTSKSPPRNMITIPELSYKTFERFHLPNVKVKVQMKSFSPKQLPVVQKEKSREPTPEKRVIGPLRVEISEYSKDYSKKLNRVFEVMKMAEREYSKNSESF